MKVFSVINQLSNYSAKMRWQDIILLSALLAFSLCSVEAFASNSVLNMPPRNAPFAMPKRSATVQYLPRINTVRAMAPSLKATPVIQRHKSEKIVEAMTDDTARRIIEVFPK
jgi:hypothetical protein